jgi:hypothetical protein
MSYEGAAAEVPDGLVHALRRRVDGINAAGEEFLDIIKLGQTVVNIPVRSQYTKPSSMQACLNPILCFVETALEPADAGGPACRTNSPEEIAPADGPARLKAGG